MPYNALREVTGKETMSNHQKIDATAKLIVMLYDHTVDYLLLDDAIFALQLGDSIRGRPPLAPFAHSRSVAVLDLANYTLSL